MPTTEPNIYDNDIDPAFQLSGTALCAIINLLDGTASIWRTCWKSDTYGRCTVAPLVLQLQTSVPRCAISLAQRYLYFRCTEQGAVTASVTACFVVYLIALRPGVSITSNAEMIALNVRVLLVNALSLVHRVAPNPTLFAAVELLEFGALLLSTALAAIPFVKLGSFLFRKKSSKEEDDPYLSKDEVAANVKYEPFVHLL